VLARTYGSRRRHSFGVASCAWRLEYEGALYHVLSRGNEGRPIFIENDDRLLFFKSR
jgi:hypothetical protein